MKHAFLILAHNEFDILKILLNCLDDTRHDIYIHFDKKVEIIPTLSTQKSNLYILNNRVDVRWGDVSVVEAELNLFQAASSNEVYAYYHLLSGVDMPLKRNEEIHSFFHKNMNKQFIGFSSGDQEEHISKKIQHIHLFSKHFKDKNSIKGFTRKLIRFAFLKFQYIFNFRRNKDITFKKGTQWVSITDHLVKMITSQREDILQRYKYTFCADEIFIQTICWNSIFRKQIYDLNNESASSQRYIQWKNNILVDWKDSDYEKLTQSPFLFARKFNSQNMEIVHRLFKYHAE